MKLNEYQNLSKRTLPTYPEALTNYALGLAGESGELIDHIKKFVFHGHTPDIGGMKDELGDVLHYLSGIATMLNLPLEDIAKYNIDKLNRRYPNGFNTHDSINREV